MKQWHGTLARYSKKNNAVAERKVAKFETSEQAIDWLNKHSNKPVYVWHTEAVGLDNPCMAMAESITYKNEYQKVID